MHITLYPQTFPLKQSFRSGGWTLESRSVILVRIEDPEDGAFGWGEAAPLPPFGTEDFDTALRALEYARDAGVLQKVDTPAAQLRQEGDPFDAVTGLTSLLCPSTDIPTARFAVETALLDLVSRRRGVPLAHLLGPARHESVPINAVIGRSGPDEAARTAAAAAEQGYSCVKMKVGEGSLDDDLKRLQRVREALPPGVLLRLDANGAWDFNTAEDALRSFQPYVIEYIEQPVPAEDVDELAALTGLNIMPVAADEAVQDLQRARELLARHAADVFVIKPMAAGSLLDARQFALDAREQDAVTVFTSLIDSAIARHAVAHICASLPASPRHHGLGTGMLFEKDSGRDRIAYGRFHLSGTPGIGVLPDILPSE